MITLIPARSALPTLDAIKAASREARGHVPTTFVPDDEEEQLSNFTKARLLAAAIGRTTLG